mgnify:CR=1
MINNYLPSYLQIARGIDATTASNWSGLPQLSGVAGTLVGGMGVPVTLEIAQKGCRGFGEGNGTDAED